MRTALVIDDEDIVRNYCVHLLKALGFSVITAEHGMEALKICFGRTEPFDLAILDWVMPVMNGALTKKHLEEKYPGMRIIVASGSVDPSEIPLTKNQVFLMKPFSAEELTKVINNMFAS